MAWAVWLAVPVGATSLAALWAWWLGHRMRRAERLDTAESMYAHEVYLATLTTPARSLHRVTSVVESSGCVVVGPAAVE